MPLAQGEITGAVLQVFYQVYNELGSGFLESVYCRALAVAFTEAGLPATPQARLTVTFRGQPVGLFEADFLVARAVIVEVKAIAAVTPTHRAQLLNYLRASGAPVGLLLNFGPSPSFERFILSTSHGHGTGPPRIHAGGR